MALGRGGGQGIGQPARSESRQAGGRPHRSRSRGLRALAIGVAVVVAGAALGAYAIYRTTSDDIRHINVSKDLGTHRPRAEPNALNILLIGSDSRGGPNRGFGAEVAGQRSDTVMVVHIAPGARRVVVLSFPRDSVVPILACAPEAGATGQVAGPAGDVEQLNATFSYGGPGCLWKTLEQTTGIRINDFIELTFTGFENLINDIGGVSVCLPVAVNDVDSRLRLSAGRHHVWGAEALAFWRARYIGEGSDLQRIQRDQYLMASLLHGIQRSGLSHSPAKIFRVLENVVGNGDVTTDTQLTLGKLVSIADELRSLPPRSVQFIEVPTVAYPGDPQAWVQWAQPQAGSLFAAIAHDTRLPSVRRRRVPGALATLQRDPALAAGTIQLILGSTFTGLASSPSASTGTTSSLPSSAALAQQYGGITGDVNICGDTAAFSGPDGDN